MERNAQRVRVLFDDVGSLSAGDRVTVSGVHKGKVDNLRLTNDGVLVELLVYQDVELRQDAQFVIKNLGVMGERFIAITPGRAIERFDLTRTVPGQAEVGLPDLDASIWFGLMAPTGTPGDVLDRLSRAVNDGLKSEALRGALDKMGYEPLGGTPDDFTRYVAAEIKKWTAAAEAAGVRK